MNGHTLTFSELEARNRELNEFADRVAHRLKRTLVNLSAYGVARSRGAGNSHRTGG
jgi:hypothetical protein